MNDDYIPDKLLDQVKEIIPFEKICDTKVLIDLGVPDHIFLKNAVKDSGMGQEGWS